MASDYESEPEESGGDEPANKRRKTGDDTFVNVPVEHEADDDDEEDQDSDIENQQQSNHPSSTPQHGGMGMTGGDGEEMNDLDGFIVNSEDEEIEDDRSHRHRKRKRKKKKRKHRDEPKITEDTLRMLAESRGEVYKPDINIDEDVDVDLDDDSDQQSDDSDGGGQRRKLTKRVHDFDEESIMGDGASDDDFHGIDDDNQSMMGDNNHNRNHNRNRYAGHSDDDYEDTQPQRRDRVADNDFVVDDLPQNSSYRYSFENDQVEKLAQIFGNPVYDFLGIPPQNRNEDINESDEEKDMALKIKEKEEKEQAAKRSEEQLKDFKRGLQGLDPKQKQKVINIINTDIPERLQERILKTDDEQLSEPALSKEAGWILKQEYFTKAQAHHREFTSEQIVYFLKHFRVNHYDVPYIYTYLQDEYSHDVKPADIWKIDELDEKYQNIYLRNKNIKILLDQIKSKLTQNIENKQKLRSNGNENEVIELKNDENQRWLRRVEDIELFLFNASTHEELEAVDLFLNIIPTQDDDDSLNGSGLFDDENGKKKKEFPQPPTDLITGDAIDLIDRFTPQNSDHQQLQDVLDQINEKINDDGAEQELRTTELEVDELGKLRGFYVECKNDPQNAAEKELDSDEFQGEEAFSFIGASQEDLEELEDTIRRITSRIQQLEDYKNQKEKEFQDQKADYETIRNYYQRCLQLMPKIKKTKKATSIKQRNGLKGRGGFKLAVPKCLIPLCNNIGFSHIIANNVHKHGRMINGPSSDLDGVVTEQTELSEICEKISTENTSKYSNAEDVKTDAIYHLARHIGHEPQLKVWVSKQLEENGVISTQPTLKGRDLITWTDELAAVKRLEHKPISKFIQDDLDDSHMRMQPQPQPGMPEAANAGPPKLHWMLINKGTRAGLIRNHMNIESNKLDDVKSHYQEIDYVDQYYENAENTIKFFLYKLAPMFIHESSKSEWKKLKLRILHDALNLYLIPTAVKWIQKKMLEHDEERVISDACTELKILANVAGQRENLRGKNILSIIVGEENSPSFLVLLNHFGDVIDDTMLHYMKTYIRLNPNSNNVISTHDRLQLEKKNGDLKLFKEFVEQHKPELIVIDAGNLLARNFKADIEKVLHSNDYTQNLRVHYVDPCVSLLYRNSDDAIKEFQSWSVCQRQAVSLGRFVLDPITELTKRWCIDSKTGKNEILSLPLHPNMADVNPNKMLTAFRKVLMDITNEVGVMLNLSSQRDFLAGPIQFLSGLGPRKAKNLVFELKKRGRFLSRDVLVKKHILGQTVYKNAIGFIRINRMLDRPSKYDDPLARSHRDRDRDIDVDRSDSEMDDEDDDLDHQINLLDDTRIHPDDYHWATVVVISAMDIDEESAYSNETLIQLRKPENLNKLEILNLDIFAERIRKRRKTRIVHKLYLIKQEVREGFKDARPKFREPDDAELYHLLCGQTRASLREGMLVNVEIKSITASGIRCRLPSCGLDAWLPAENISAGIRDEFGQIKNKHNGDIQNENCRTERKDLILSFLKQKTHLEARVISIDKGRFSVKLSCLRQDIENKNNRHEIPLNCDQFLNRTHKDDDSNEAVKRARREAIKNRPLHRNIKYPAFMNISRDEALKKLKASKGCGQLIFRPSSRGLNYLSMTWKMADNPDIFVNYVIQEKDKPNPYAVGQKLIIDKEVYDDLDEIYTHHKPRLNELVSTMIQHKNFRYGTENDIKEMLQDEINVNNRTCYALSYSYERPGHFLLSYITANSRSRSASSSRVQREYIGLTYTGYRFRQHFFDTPVKLVNWWKQNFKKNHPKYAKREKMMKQQAARNNGYGNHGGGSLNDDVMFNNHHDNAGGYHNNYNNQGHQPPPPHYNNGGHGGYNQGGGGGGGYNNYNSNNNGYNNNHNGYNNNNNNHNHNHNNHRNGNYRHRSRSREPNNGYNNNSNNYNNNNNYNNRY